ncbi:response regulator [Pseudomonas sp. NPDC007930]|uniref:response regulator n=1 Tax=Pseudomonas sp. NPDC007930 TaxID=3364417 RepID=UPI0036EFAE5E
MNTVYIIDDHPVVRLAVRMLLETEGYVVLGESDNGVDGMQQVRDSQPDLLILDISIPRLDGLELLARYQHMGSGPRILVLTGQSPTLFAARCMQSGACGFVRKGEDLSELLSAVRAALSGYHYFPRQALDTLANPAAQRSDLARVQEINDRELMVLQLYAQGRSNKEIAQSMFLSNKTVSTYKKRLMDKLGMGSVADLIGLAKRVGLV